MRKPKVNTAAIMAEAHRHITKLYPQRTREFHPLVEMLIFAADPEHPPHISFAANKECAQYLIPKMKSVEHTGGDDGLQVVLLNYSDAADQNMVPALQNQQKPETKKEEATGVGHVGDKE